MQRCEGGCETIFYSKVVRAHAASADGARLNADVAVVDLRRRPGVGAGGVRLHHHVALLERVGNTASWEKPTKFREYRRPGKPTKFRNYRRLGKKKKGYIAGWEKPTTNNNY